MRQKKRADIARERKKSAFGEPVNAPDLLSSAGDLCDIH
jgi:hypothetical protein